MFGKSSMSAEEHQSSWMVFRPGWKGRGTTSNIRAITSKTLRVKKYFSFHFGASPVEQKNVSMSCGGGFGTGSKQRSATVKVLKATVVLGDMSRWLEEAEGSSSRADQQEKIQRVWKKVTVTAGYSILHRAPHAACLLCVNAGGAAAPSQEQEEWMTSMVVFQ